MAESVTLARPYAKAAFEFAKSQQQLAVWSDKLQLLAEVAADAQTRALLLNPKFTVAEEVALFLSLAGEVDEPLENFLRLLADTQRLAVLPEIAALFVAYRAEEEKTLEVQVSSVEPLSNEYQERLIEKLTQRLQRQVTLVCQIDKSLIGGAVIRAGDMVMDGSVQGKLKRLEESITI